MSDETKARLAEAIAAHVADESDGDLAGGWVMIAECLTLSDVEEGLAAHWFDHEGSQYTARGLVESARDTMRFAPGGGED